jgi:hypothetical protein
MIPQKFRYHVLARTVAEVDSRPCNPEEVAVLLEVLGFFKKDNLEPTKFSEIAKKVQRLIPFYSGESDDSKKNMDDIRWKHVRTFASGMIFSALWSLMLLALYLGGISLWTVNPDKAGPIPAFLATSIAVGVVISFIVTGGVQQVFSFRMSFYRLQDNLPLARKEAVRGYWVGFLAIAIAASAFIIMNGIAFVSPLQFTLYTVLFLILLGGYRILVTPLYSYRKFPLIAIGLAIALTSLYVAYYALKDVGVLNPYDVIVAQVIALGILNGITALECFQSILREKRHAIQNLDNQSLYHKPVPLKNVKQPRLSVVFIEMLPLFLFGTMFYVLLFSDRLASWISASGGPILLIYNASYQLGADIAMLVLIPLTGLIYYFLEELAELLQKESSKTNIANRAELKTKVYRYVAKMFAITGLAAGACVIVLWQFADSIVQMTNGEPESVLVLRVGLIAYSLFAFFLANTFISFSFRRYSTPALLLVLATVAELGTNLVGPRLLSAWNPVYGLLGSIILVTLISSLNTVRFIRQTHYFYYAAF